MNVSPSAVTKPIKRYDESGSHEDRHRNGRPRVTSAAEDKFIRVTSLKNSKQILTQSSSNRHISTSTVLRRLSESGLYGRIAEKKPLLNDTNKKKRLAWDKKYKQWTLDWWTSVLWSNEFKFEIFGSNTHCISEPMSR